MARKCLFLFLQTRSFEPFQFRTFQNGVGLYMEVRFFENFFLGIFLYGGGMFLEVKILENFDPIWGFHPKFCFRIHQFLVIRTPDDEFGPQCPLHTGSIFVANVKSK